jgi:hypothetical protein
MIGTEDCTVLCDLLSGGCGSGMAAGAEMPIEPDTPSGELEPGVRPAPGDPDIPGMVGDIPGIAVGGAGIAPVIPGIIREVPAEDAVGVAAGYVASAGFDDANPPPFRCCGAGAEACGFGLSSGGEIRFAVTTPSTRSPVTNNSPAMI